MIEFWGADICPSCKQAQTLLSRTPIPYRYVDVSRINFEGEIPRIILENGNHIIGLGPINSFIKQRLLEMRY